MINPKAVWSSTLDKLAAFDWKKLIPKFKHETYPFGAAGIEFTWKVGPGIGLGLGVLDIWVGWPRHRESLHHDGCKHEVFLA